MKKLYLSFIFLSIMTSSVYAGYQCPVGTPGGQWIQISSCSLSETPDGGLWYENSFECTDGSRKYFGKSYNTFVSCDSAVYNCTGEGITEAPCSGCVYTGYNCGVPGWPWDCNDHRFNGSITVQEYQCPCQSSEICDGLDNNCNGAVDEGCGSKPTGNKGNPGSGGPTDGSGSGGPNGGSNPGGSAAGGSAGSDPSGPCK